MAQRGYLNIYTNKIQCASASTAATNFGTVMLGKEPLAFTLTAHPNNAGTIYVGATILAGTGIPLTAGQSVDFGPVSVGSCGGACPPFWTASVNVVSTGASPPVDYVICTWFAVE